MPLNHRTTARTQPATIPAEVPMPGAKSALSTLLGLPKRGRVRATEALLESLGPPPDAPDGREELDRRLAEADAGTDRAKPWPQVRRSLAAARRRRRSAR